MSVGYGYTSVDTIEIPDIEKGLFIPDDCSLAFHLGFKNRVFWYAINCREDMYKVYAIPKRRGGKRLIHAPNPMMKTLLRQAHFRLLVPLQEELGAHVTAYRKGHSTKQAVAQHIPKCPVCDGAKIDETPPHHKCPRKGTYINLDLQDFFPNTRRSWIRNYFKELGYSHFVAGLIAQLLTVNMPNPRYGTKFEREGERKYISGVPQGSPASGAICNIIADWKLDKNIIGYMDELNTRHNITDPEWQWKYTRYSDDLAFTCGKNLPIVIKEQIAKRLVNICNQSGYRVNKRKTRITNTFYRKQLLGIVFNVHPNIAKDEYLKLRALIHNCLVQGFDTQYKKAGKENIEELITWVTGKANYVYQINPDRGARLLHELKVALKVREEESADVRTPTAELDKVFTYAESSYANDTPDLVFSSLQKDESILSEATMLKIAEDQLTQETLGLPFLIMCKDNNIIATTDFEHVIDLLERASTTDKIIWRTTKGIEVVRPADIFDNCALPHKYVLGCKECLTDRETTNHCIPKESIIHYGGDCQEASTDVDELEEWKHRKLNIANFTYISPLLTAPENIAKRKRSLSEHDFSYVEERSDIRSKALTERHRRNRFYKEECSRCYGKEHCSKYHYRFVTCEGPYLYTEKEATEEILNMVTIPFSNAQIRYLLRNSGELKKRLNRCKYISTFYMKGATLSYGLQRLTIPYADKKPFDGYRDAHQFIQQYGYDHKPYPYPVTKSLKARLCLIASYESSPYCSGGFGNGGTYPAQCIRRHGDTLTQYYGMTRGYTYWRTREISSIANAMKYDRDIEYLSRTPSDHEKKHQRWY